MTIWLTILGMGAITYAIRAAFFLLPERFEISPLLRQALAYVPPAVLSAIILPELLLPGGTLDLSPSNARLLAGVVAIAVAWRTENILWTLAAGMGVLWGIQALWP